MSVFKIKSDPHRHVRRKIEQILAGQGFEHRTVNDTLGLETNHDDRLRPAPNTVYQILVGSPAHKVDGCCKDLGFIDRLTGRFFSFNGWLEQDTTLVFRKGEGLQPTDLGELLHVQLPAEYVARLKVQVAHFEICEARSRVGQAMAALYRVEQEYRELTGHKPSGVTPHTEMP